MYETGPLKGSEHLQHLGRSHRVSHVHAGLQVYSQTVCSQVCGAEHNGRRVSNDEFRRHQETGLFVHRIDRQLPLLTLRLTTQVLDGY